MNELLRIDHLSVHFPLRGGMFRPSLGRASAAVRAVDDIDLTVGRGEILALVGESGSGKTTTGRAIVKLQRPTGGRILLDGEDAALVRGRAGMRAYRRRVQMIFQDPYQALNPRQSIFDSVAEAVRGLRLTKTRSELEERVVWALETAGLRPATEFVGRFPNQLSGGQRQRVVIAGALVARPELIVADEPVSMLDVSIRAQILEVLVNLRRSQGVAFLFITHDLAVAWQIADRLAVMYLGRIVEIGDTQEVIFRPRHPYTRALLDAAPRPHVDATRVRARPLPGEIPNAARIPSGCRFNPRCPLAFDRCRIEEPPFFAPDPRHAAACWLANEVPQPSAAAR